MRQLIHPVIAGSTHLDNFSARDRFIFLFTSFKSRLCEILQRDLGSGGQVGKVISVVKNLRTIYEILVPVFLEVLSNLSLGHGVYMLHHVFVRIVCYVLALCHLAPRILEQNCGYLTGVGAAQLIHTISVLHRIIYR
ncbi:hypothetical protein FR483_n650L [Paramecium bursaria Chlorella virus FR483]|uniref:Uncharacterized protein n650L n=1 Tax=Paramecium bursaria Chlorella virus FR483 TaxID=399781 RepID=A7J804_PBCVF|nr:hypothetical protein FR483_n650L [Paramecium bursaria Chlorella virus FR483]ABT15935.1 hypothetical protein FR483_n650L [Paramecium bursaria Chlorella virus FR483]